MNPIFVAVAAAGGAAAIAKGAAEAANASTALQAMITDIENYELRELILGFTRKDQKKIPEGFEEAKHPEHNPYIMESISDSKLLVKFPIIKKEKEKTEVGFFRTKIVEGKETNVKDYENISLSEALKRVLPENSIVIDIAIDWYNKYFRVYYLKKIN